MAKSRFIVPLRGAVTTRSFRLLKFRWESPDAEYPQRGRWTLITKLATCAFSMPPSAESRGYFGPLAC